MHIEIKDEDLGMLLKMVSRGWDSGELADYLEADQIQSCVRVMLALGLTNEAGLPQAAHNPGQQKRRP